MNDGSIKALVIMARGNINQKTWIDIQNICLTYSRNIVKKGRGLRDLPHKSNGRLGVSRMELSNLLSNFKKEIINDVATQFNTIKAQRKNDEVDAMLTEYCPHFREKKNNYRCKNVASMETQPMSTEFKAINENEEVLYFTQIRPWVQR